MAEILLLLHLNGADEATETVDATGRHSTINFNNTAQLDTAQQKYGSASLLLNNFDYLDLPDSGDWDAVSSVADYTIDLFIKHADHAGAEGYVNQYVDPTHYWMFSHINGSGLAFNIYDGTQILIVNASGGAGEITDTDWHHAAICKVGIEYGLYLDGTQVAYVSNAVVRDFVGSLFIGKRGANDSYFDGHLDEIRIADYNLFGATPNAGLLDTIAVPIHIIITPDTLELALAQHAPTISLDFTVTPNTLELALTQHAPTISLDFTVTPNTLELALTRHVSTTSIGQGPITWHDRDSVNWKNSFVRWKSGSLATMPPAMHEDLIDPYVGGAWLWLVEITIPGYSDIRYARNTEDVFYAGRNYPAFNFDVGLGSLVGDGSVPRYGLVIAHDGDYTLEDIINATEGAGGGTITIIRVHEDFLDEYILELVQEVTILTANSDTDNITFQLGIPNPLLKKIPLRRYSSKKCPYALPSLFKGLECQYAGADPICTGKYEDCFTKGNIIHWGGEIGLDPAAAKA